MACLHNHCILLHFSTPEVEIQVHNVVRVAAFMKLHLHGLILSTRSYQSENLSPLELSISYFDILLLDGTLKQEPTRVTLW